MYKFNVIQIQTTNIKNQHVSYHSYCGGKIEPEDKRHGSPAASHSYFRKKPKLVTEYSYVRMLRI